MKFGLNEEQYNFIQNNVVQKFESKGSEVFVFGSRAKGGHTNYSDLDLLIRSVEASIQLKKLKSEIEEFLENSNFPFKVELVFENEVAESYQEDIIGSMAKF